MDRIAPEGSAINEATGIGHILMIFLNDFSLKNAEEDLIEREMVLLGLHRRLIGDTYRLLRIASILSSMLTQDSLLT